MSNGPGKSTPSGWSVGLCIGLGIALVETMIVALMYRDLPLADTGRFLVVYAAGYGAASAVVGGGMGAMAAVLLGWRPAAIAVGLGLGWALLLGYRGYRVSMHPSWTGDPVLPFTWIAGGVAVGAAAIAVVGYVLARTRLGRLRFALPATGLLAIVGLVGFLTRSEASAHATIAEPGPGPTVTSPIEPNATNLLILSIDTLRADHTSPYGYGRDTSPHMADLARRGVLFERCLVQRTHTAPSVATLMTGTYPPTHRMFNNKNRLHDSNRTLAEMLADEGYVTAAFNTNPAIGPHFNYQQGFQHFEMTAARIAVDELDESRTVNRTVLGWLQEHHREKFFLWVHYKDPHTPYVVPPEYENLYESDALATLNNHLEVPTGKLRQAYVLEGSQEVDRYIGQYDAEIKFVDDALGEVFEALERWGLRQNTLVVLTSDHGEDLGERAAYFKHGDYCSEPTARVPLILAHPQLPSGLVVTQPVSLVDVLPTICDLLALPAEPVVQGRSLAPLLLGGGPAEFRRYHYIMGSYRFGYLTHAVTTDRYKLVDDVDEWWILFDEAVETLARAWLGDAFTMQDKTRCRVIKRALYDLREDPAETINLAGKGLAAEAELVDQLRRWQEYVYRAGAARTVTAGDATPEVLQELRDFGYLN